MNYSELNAQHQKEFDSFPIFFAFNTAQLKIGLEQLNATRDEIISIGSGGFTRKTDVSAFNSLMKKQSDAREVAILDNDFLVSAILYELGNHEFFITYDPTDTINALGIDLTDDRVASCFEKAQKEYLASCDF